MPQAELESIFRLEAEGAAIRARSKYKLDGEKASKLFCSLEKYNGSQKFIPQLVKHINGSKVTLTKQSEVEGEIKHFYQKLEFQGGVLLCFTYISVRFAHKNPLPPAGHLLTLLTYLFASLTVSPLPVCPHPQLVPTPEGTNGGGQTEGDKRRTHYTVTLRNSALYI